MASALSFHSYVGTDAPRVAVKSGCADALDRLAETADVGRRFLRAAWYAATAPLGQTLVAERGDGTPLLAVPTVTSGPAGAGIRSVPGGYWPFRSVALAADARVDELAAALSAPIARTTLGRAWRVGPTYADDPAVVTLVPAAEAAGWCVLRRTAGRVHLLKLDALTAERAWPSRSACNRIAKHEAQLDTRGSLRCRHVGGADWDADVLATLGRIEANSWVGRATDGRGAKFLTVAQRAAWATVLRDPVLADALSATILIAGNLPVAFSFDLIQGARQYAIASSYDQAFAPVRPGRIVTHRQLIHARAAGVRVIDLGAGDSGYKREMGAVPGPELVDLLFVRHRATAAMLRPRWR